jgi:hypothetical protein
VSLLGFVLVIAAMGVVGDAGVAELVLALVPAVAAGLWAARPDRAAAHTRARA